MYSLPSQPQGIGKVLDSGIRLYVNGLKKVIGLALVGGLAAGLPNLLNPQYQSPDAVADLSGLGVYIAAVIAGAVIGLVIMVAILYRLGAVAAGHDISMKDAIDRGLRRFLLVFAASILYGVAVMLGMVLLIVPGMILMITLSLYTVAIVLDDEGVVESLKLSHKLVWGNWWRTVIIYTVPTFILIVLYMAIGLVAGVSIGISGMEAQPDYEAVMQASLMFNLLLALVQALVSPLFYAILIVVYHDLKLRKGGGDLDARLEGATIQM